MCACVHYLHAQGNLSGAASWVYETCKRKAGNVLEAAIRFEEPAYRPGRRAGRQLAPWQW
jgi:hypothetical protein